MGEVTFVAVTASKIAGLVVSLMMLAIMLHLHGRSITLNGLWKLLLKHWDRLLTPRSARW